MASAPSTALLDWTTRARRRATRTRSHTRWGWRSNANLARATQQAHAHIVVTTISTLLARLALRLARGLKARDELAALCVPLTALARWQVNVATPPALSLRPHVDETLALPHLVASLRTRRNRR